MHMCVCVCVSNVGEPRKFAEKHVYVKKKTPIKSIGWAPILFGPHPKSHEAPFPTTKQIIQTGRINVWYFYQHLVELSGKCK